MANVVRQRSRTTNPNLEGQVAGVSRNATPSVVFSTVESIYASATCDVDFIPKDDNDTIWYWGEEIRRASLSSIMDARKVLAPSAFILRVCFLLVGIAFLATSVILLALANRANQSTFSLYSLQFDTSGSIPVPSVAPLVAFNVPLSYVAPIGALLAGLLFIVIFLFGTDSMADTFGDRFNMWWWFGVFFLVFFRAFSVLQLVFVGYAYPLIVTSVVLAVSSLLPIVIDDQISRSKNTAVTLVSWFSLLGYTLAVVLFEFTLISSYVHVRSFLSAWTTVIVWAAIIASILYWLFLVLYTLRALKSYITFMWLFKILLVLDMMLFYWLLFFNL